MDPPRALSVFKLGLQLSVFLFFVFFFCSQNSIGMNKHLIWVFQELVVLILNNIALVSPRSRVRIPSVEALIFFRLLLSNCLDLKIYCDDHSSHSILNKLKGGGNVDTILNRFCDQSRIGLDEPLFPVGLRCTVENNGEY